MNDPHAPAGSGAEHAPRTPAQSPAAGRMTGGSIEPLLLDSLDAGRGDDRDEIDLLAYWRVLVKRRRVVLLGLAVGAALAVLLTLMTTPIYRATAVLQLEREVPEIVQVEGITQVQGGNDNDFYQTQYELLKSRTLAERVADELKLADPEALRRLHPGSWRDRIFSGSGSAAPGARRVAPTAEQRRAAADLVQRSLVIEPVRNSALIHVNFDSPSPDFAARGANAIADGFIASGIERRFGATSYARRYLETQLAAVKARLEASERELVAFAQKEGIVSNAEGRSLVSQNLGELTSELAAAQNDRIRAEARWRQAAAGTALPPDMLKDSIIPALRQERAKLRGQYQEQLAVFKPEYPAMKQLAGQVAEIDRQIARELANIRASVRAEYDAAAAHERMLTGQLSQLRGQALDVENRSIRYTILKREVDTNRELYDGLLQRYKEVGVAGQVSRNNISIVDRAEAPRGPYKPSLLKNLLLGALLGLALGMLIAFVREFVDDTLKSSEDIEQHLRLPVLGVIPKLRPKQTIAQGRDDPRSAFSESYRSVRTALQFSTDQGVPPVLLLTSAGAGDGKSTSALSLALNFTQLGKRVLLLEGDLRNPSLRTTMGLRSDIGLSSILAGANTMSEAIQSAQDERLKVILAGPLPPNPAELLSGPRLVALLAEASEAFDQVIIDGPPVLGISDAPILSHVASGTLLVVHAGKTKIAAARAAAKRLLAARGHMIGALLTMYDAKTSGAYGYDAYHAYDYGQDPGSSRN